MADLFARFLHDRTIMGRGFAQFGNPEEGKVLSISFYTLLWSTRFCSQPVVLAPVAQVANRIACIIELGHGHLSSLDVDWLLYQLENIRRPRLRLQRSIGYELIGVKYGWPLLNSSDHHAQHTLLSFYSRYLVYVGFLHLVAATTICGQDFLAHSTGKYSEYVYNGSVAGILASDRSAMITLDGCRKLCGDGVAYYPWKAAANTITTWVLPIIGLLVQAPFESNQAWQTMLALFRWAGSPIASLSYIFWNIKVTGKCAIMIDMSVKYDEYPPEDSDFSHMRDSLYILCIMNQYTSSPSLPPIEAERLLRVTLFSNSLQLCGSDEKRDSLLSRRTELATALREGRNKGVIPVLISFLWFVFALGLSIELAFNDIGGNATAHDLAIGLLVGWLPVLVVGCTVDRNLVASDAIREKLNELIKEVRHALLDPTNESDLHMKPRSTAADFAAAKVLNQGEVSEDEFFVGFGGQGRTHFHYGVAHPILSGIETKFIAEYGRNWLSNGHAARYHIVVGSQNVMGLKMFDPRMIRQIISAILIVAGTVFSSFILSWYTPTVGLGCRTGGYLVYIIIAMGLLIIEMLTWWITHQTTHTHQDPLRRVGSGLKRRFSSLSAKQSAHKRNLDAILSWFHTSAFRDFVRNIVLRPIEAFNTGWLAYIIAAQTFGSYQTCECMASDWAGRGGYIDFQTYDVYIARGVYVYWGVATALSCVVMGAGLGYIVHEYCTQSHMSTDHFGRAMQGLKMTRWCRKHTRFIRFLPNHVISIGRWVGWKLSGGTTRKHRRSLVWTAHTYRDGGMADIP